MTQSAEPGTVQDKDEHANGQAQAPRAWSAPQIVELDVAGGTANEFNFLSDGNCLT